MNMLSSMDLMMASFTQRSQGAYGMESINANFTAQGLGGGGMFESMNTNFAVGLGARSANYDLGQMWPMLISGLLGLLSGGDGGCPQPPQQQRPQNWLPAFSEPQPAYSEPSPQLQIGPVSQQVNVSNTNSTVINNNVTNNVTINPARPYPVEFQGQIGFTPDGKTIVLPGIGMTGTRTVDNPFYGKPLPTDIAGRVGIDQFGNGLKVTMAEVMAT